jgi:pentatricopeptide repeat protein
VPDLITTSSIGTADAQGARACLESLMQAKVTPDVRHFANALKVSDADEAMAIYDRMRDCGVQPNGVTFLNLITACTRSGHLDDALKMHDEMLRLGITPDIKTYVSVICARTNMRRITRALEFHDEMRRYDIPRDELRDPRSY